MYVIRSFKKEKKGKELGMGFYAMLDAPERLRAPNRRKITAATPTR